MKYIINNNNVLNFEYIVTINNKNKQIRIYKGNGRSKAFKAYKKLKKSGDYHVRINVYYFNTKLERYNYFENFFK